MAGQKIKLKGYRIGKDGKLKKEQRGLSVSEKIRQRSSKKQRPVRRTV